MKTENSSIYMAGEKMDVLFDSGCVRTCKPFVAARLPQITAVLCKTLSRRDVARHFIQDIRIGDTVALVDQHSGFTYRLRVQAHSIHVLGVYQKSDEARKPAQQTLILLNDRLLYGYARKAA